MRYISSLNIKRIFFPLALVVSLTASARQVTFDFVANDYGLERYSNENSDYIEDGTSITSEGVTLTFKSVNEDSSNKSGCRLWSTSGFRMYRDGTIIITAGGNMITGVTIDPPSGINIEGTSTGVWSGEAREVLLAYPRTSGNAQFTSLTITYAGSPGDGTAANPYLITNAEDLSNAYQLVFPDKVTYFKQTADIDMAGVKEYYAFSRRYYENNFRGAIVYDGGHHLISNFSPDYVADGVSQGYYNSTIFGVLIGKVMNLGVVNANVDTSSNDSQGAGILCGYVGRSTNGADLGFETSTFENVFVTGSLKAGSNNAGAFAGGTESPVELINCYANVNVESTGSYSGALIGRLNKSMSISNCYVAGTVASGALVAGFGWGGLITVDGLVVFNTGTDLVFRNGYTGEVTMANTSATKSAGISTVSSWPAFSVQKPVLGYPGLASFDYTDGSQIVSPVIHNLKLEEIWCNGVKNGVADPIPGLDAGWIKPTPDNQSTATCSRFAVGKDGKLITTDHTTNSLVAWDGKQLTTYFDLPAVTTDKWNGTAITSDDAGNIILNFNFSDAVNSLRSWGVLDKNKKLTEVTLSTSYEELNANGRLDIISHIVGDVTSEKGGIGYAAIKNTDHIVMFHFKGDGTKVTSVTAKSSSVVPQLVNIYSDGGVQIEAFQAAPKYSSIDEILASSAPENEFYFPIGKAGSSTSTVPSFTEGILANFNGTTYAPLTVGNRGYGAVATFKLGDKKYIIRNYVAPDSPNAELFSIWKNIMAYGIFTEDGDCVLSWEGSTFTNANGTETITVEPVDNRSVNIYFYVTTGTGDAASGTEAGAYCAMFRVTDEDLPLLVTKYPFVSASPRPGSSYAQSKGLPNTIETVWRDVEGTVVVRKKAALCNEYNDTVAHLSLAQSVDNPAMITLSLDAIYQAPGEYRVIVPQGAFTDAYGRISNEEADFAYHVYADGETANYSVVEGKYLMNVAQVTTNGFGITIPDRVVVGREGDMLSIIFENLGGFESLSAPAAVYNNSTREITFKAANYGLIPIGNGMSFYVRFDPVVYSSSTAYNKTDYTVKFNEETGTIAFPEGHGFLWSIYRDKDYTQQYGNLIGFTVTSLVKYEDTPIYQPVQLEAPTMSYNGRYMTITAEDGAQIMMSVNSGTFEPYTGVFDVKGRVSVEAYAMKDGYQDSDRATYQVNAYGSDLYAELGNGGSLDDAYRWADATTRSKILSNPNFLVYAFGNYNSTGLGSITNLVVDGRAARIRLSDSGDWYCPYEFETSSISYIRTFTKKTAIDGGCAGWETIALPFDVQSIESEERGYLYPFAANSDSNKHRFWLYEPTGSDWAAASEIEANVPYLIAMPNNEAYYADYNISGDVSFSAENVVVRATPDDLTYDYRDGYKITANYRNLAADSKRLVVNDTVVAGALPGSVFVADHRAVRPFEAYLTAPGQNRVPIFHTTSLPEAMMAGMSLRVWADTSQTVSIFAPFDAEVKVYDIAGRAVRTIKVAAGDTVRLTDLPSGIYIIEKTKIAIRK